MRVLGTIAVAGSLLLCASVPTNHLTGAPEGGVQSTPAQEVAVRAATTAAFSMGQMEVFRVCLYQRVSQSPQNRLMVGLNERMQAIYSVNGENNQLLTIHLPEGPSTAEIISYVDLNAYTIRQDSRIRLPGERPLSSEQLTFYQNVRTCLMMADTDMMNPNSEGENLGSATPREPGKRIPPELMWRMLNNAVPL